jgi:hypothetical protein
MQMQYKRTRDFNKKIDSLLENNKKSTKDTSFTGLLARKTAKQTPVNKEDPMNRIANFVGFIRNKRMELKNADE